MAKYSGLSIAAAAVPANRIVIGFALSACAAQKAYEPIASNTSINSMVTFLFIITLPFGNDFHNWSDQLFVSRPLFLLSV